MKTTKACALRLGKTVAKIGYIALIRRGGQMTLGNASEDLKRALKRTRRSAFDVVDDAIFLIKRQPLQSIGTALGTAFVLGACVGRFARR